MKEALQEDFKIAEEEIAIATGSSREIEGVDLFSRDCGIRFVITVAALREGWDCSFAYVLCSVAEIGSSRAVEQILGRVLRLPLARKKEHGELNCAYALATSTRFVEAASSLKDALIENGFQRMEAELFVQPERESAMTFFEAGTMFFEAEAEVAEEPDLKKLSEELRESVEYDPVTKKLSVRKALSAEDSELLESCFSTPEGKRTAQLIYEASQGRKVGGAPVAAREPRRLQVPALAVRVDGKLELFEESHFLDGFWQLSKCDLELTEKEFPSTYVSGQTGKIDVSEAGRVEIDFANSVHRQMMAIEKETGWNVPSLANWLDRQIPHPDIVQTESTLFIHSVLTRLLETRGLTVDQLAAEKFRLRKALEGKIDEHRQAAANASYQRALFDKESFEVGPEICFEISEEEYSPNRYYSGDYRLRKHYFASIGELDSEEEFKCAVFLDEHEETECWIRNLDRRATGAFWLQTSSDKFYPDFVVRLKDGRFLVVESKGDVYWSNDDSKEKRALGELWADRSKGQCVFVMPKGADWGAINAAIRGG